MLRKYLLPNYLFKLVHCKLNNSDFWHVIQTGLWSFLNPTICNGLALEKSRYLVGRFCVIPQKQAIFAHLLDNNTILAKVQSEKSEESP